MARVVACWTPRTRYAGVSFKGVQSLTLPNDALTIRQIIKRFIRNQSLPIEKEGAYLDIGEDVEKIRTADFTEREEFLDRHKTKLNRIKKDLEDKEAASKKAAEEKAEADRQAIVNEVRAKGSPAPKEKDG